MQYDSYRSRSSQRLNLAPLKTALALVLALLLGLAQPCLLAPLSPSSSDSAAWAVTNAINDEPDELQQEIERTSSEYNAALEKSNELAQQIVATQNEIDLLEAQLPGLQLQAESAADQLYRFSSQRMGLIDLVLNAQSLSDFLATIDYLNYIQDNAIESIAEVTQAKEDLENMRADLEAQKEAADEETRQAAAALAEAQAAREEAQRRAREAAEAERKKAEEQKRQQEQEQRSQEGEEAEGASDDSDNLEPPSDDGANWDSDKASFVAEWAPRIDRYLSGSPLSGTGKIFAEAAWDYGVDPRWSPAISCTESSKGTYCFLPHNAWGWGSVSWSSWDEAIRSHVRGLARGYGYTISEAAAKKYCPPNWQHWYNTTKSQMNLI